MKNLKLEKVNVMAIKILGMFALALSVLALSCSKDDNVDNQAVIDDEIIVKYLSDNSKTAIKHNSGVYYTIHASGSGTYPTNSSIVSVKYKGWLVDGTVFDQTLPNAPYQNYLGNLIQGWQIGISMIKPGGKITLYIPSRYGYKNRAAGIIPANSVLIFDVELVAIL